MIELKTYTYEELSEILHTKNNQGIKRKLTNYGVIYTCTGRGKNVEFQIQQIQNPFKLFCILELGIPAQSDFRLLRNFFFYFFGDENFSKLPINEMEARMHADNKYISRQTIAKWINYLQKHNFFSLDEFECIYYKSAYINGTHKLEEIPKETYRKGWAQYWNMRNRGFSASAAFATMYETLGGKPVKVKIPQFNGIYTNTINTLFQLASDSIQQEILINKE